MKRKQLSLSILLLLTAGKLLAAEQLPTSIISASVVDADKQVSVDGQRVDPSEGAQLITDKYIRAQQASTLADVLRKTISVQIDEEGGQQGNLIFIRGFTQDQVSVRVEGAPKNFNQVRHGGAGTVWIEPDMYQSVNVIPGVASNVYGNGSLGGVVLLETKDPENIIAKGEKWGGAVRTGLESNARSKYISADLALAISEQLSLSSTLVSRKTDQYKDGDGKKALLGSTGTDDRNLLLKAVYTPDEAQRLEVSYTGLRKEYEARTTVGSGAYGAPSETEVDDNTYSLQYLFNPEDNQYLDMNLRLSRADTERWRLQEGQTVPAIWAVETSYVELENVSTFFQTDDLTHQLRYGLDYTFDDVRTAYTSANGQATTAERTQYGVYLSDSLSFGENIGLVASLRYDNFDSQVEGTPATSESAVSPKLSINWRPFEDTAVQGLGFFAVAGKGFRTPSVHEARADAGPACGRRSCSERVSNPNLKGESSKSWELGVNFSRAGLLDPSDQLDFRVAYISNQAEDYIASVVLRSYQIDVTGNSQLDNVDVVQYVNVDKAEIEGVELSINYTNAFWFAALTAQNIDGTYASGTQDGEKLPGISPASANFSVGAYLFEGKSRIGVDASHRSSRKFVQRGSNRRRQSYTTYDVFASYQVNANWLAQVRVENVLDELYSKRTIVQIAGEDTTTYASGRNVKFTMAYNF